MPFPFDIYPWTNYQELNLAYFIARFQEIFRQWTDLYDTMTAWQAQTDADLEAWKNGVISDINARETALRQELTTWKTTTEQDISSWESATLSALAAWQTAAETQFEAIRVQAAASATAAAGSSADASAAKTAAETAQAAAEAAAASVSSAAAQIQTNTADIADLELGLTAILNMPDLSWTPGFINSSGTVSSSNYSRITPIVVCKPGDRIKNNTPARDSNNVSLLCYLATYHDATFLERVGLFSYRDYTLGDNVNGFRILFGRSSTTGVTFDDATDFDYLDLEFYLKPESYQDAVSTTQEINNRMAFMADNSPEMFVYTDFDEIAGYWTADGSLTGSDPHTQRLKIIPGGTLYLVNRLDQDIQGAYFDRFGSWIAPVYKAAMTVYSYEDSSRGYEPSGGYHFITMYQFTAPANAYYVSLNLQTSSTEQYRNYLASKPVFAHAGTGNIAVSDDPAYTYTKNRKLCVIGASLTALDRASRALMNNEYLCGWQEYLYPWYGSAETYGYSGGAMADTSAHTDIPYMSIYQGIVVSQANLAQFDDFIIFHTKNSLEKLWYDVGTWGTIDDATVDVTTYMGGLRTIVEYILSQNNKARIWLTTIHHYGNEFNENVDVRERIRTKCNDINTQTRQMAEDIGLLLIDLEREMGFNASNFHEYTYDGTHFNQDGARLAGHVIRKAVIGI